MGSNYLAPISCNWRAGLPPTWGPGALWLWLSVLWEGDALSCEDSAGRAGDGEGLDTGWPSDPRGWAI